MALNNSVPANGYGAPSCVLAIGEGVLAAWNLALGALLWTMIISAATLFVNMAVALILGLVIGMSNLYGNELPSVGIVILLEASEKVVYSTSKKEWSGILTRHKDWIQAEIKKLLEEQQNLEIESDDLYTLHLDQSAEIADCAVISGPVIRDRVNRFKMIREKEKRITKMRMRRLLYCRAAVYFEILEESKRGQRVRSWDLWLGIWIHIYCISLWIFDMAFCSIWATIHHLESVLAFATGSWGVGLKLIITH